eukprot:TRINITY_DN1115_c0_g1_i4.p1 TRINITY_DN1115_c0_g1~~TRINITY_DN1115_c0_g1_i4.p1  ORF type:complete len:264 (+),score=43.82 TRINITY_DN1115_c0_g1_i4:180-971(+)
MEIMSPAIITGGKWVGIGISGIVLGSFGIVVAAGSLAIWCSRYIYYTIKSRTNPGGLAEYKKLKKEPGLFQRYFLKFVTYVSITEASFKGGVLQILSEDPKVISMFGEIDVEEVDESKYMSRMQRPPGINTSFHGAAFKITNHSKSAIVIATGNHIQTVEKGEIPPPDTKHRKLIMQEVWYYRKITLLFDDDTEFVVKADSSEDVVLDYSNEHFYSVGQNKENYKEDVEYGDTETTIIDAEATEVSSSDSKKNKKKTNSKKKK